MFNITTRLLKSLLPFSLNFRNKRFLLLKLLFLSSSNTKKVRILDIGGTQEFWEPHKSNLKNCAITILNLIKIPVTLPNFISVIGDARDMKQFKDKEFDLVFSNSVIEHVGNWEDQKKMAKEIQRVGKRYFIQTPNYYFPIEPHFFFPFFQLLPLRIKIFLIRHFTLGWRSQTKAYTKAIKAVNSIRLLKKQELQLLFPMGKVFEEKIVWLTKSFVIYN